MKCYITLRDTENKLSNLRLEFNIVDNVLGKAWSEHVIKNFINSNHPIEKEYSLKGWIDSWDSESDRNLEFLCDELNRAISVVNQNLFDQGYPFINLHYTIDKLQSSEYRDLMNQIHHHFENMIGQIWSPGVWYELADLRTKNNIRLLNNICHEIENCVHTISEKSSAEHNNLWIYASLMGPNSNGKYFKEKKITDLELEHYKCFSRFKDWGTIELYYSQLGKRHVEVWHDCDQHIDYENISGYRYLTGEFKCNFDPSTLYHSITHSSDYLDWLKKHHWDYNDPMLAIDYPIVANINNVTTLNQRIELAHEIHNRNDLYMIEIEINNQLYSKSYEYTWIEQWDDIRSFFK